MSQLHADLLALKENLLEHGWYQGKYSESSAGGPRCIVGGINSVVSDACYPSFMRNCTEARRATSAKRFLEKLVVNDGLCHWNDTPGRTFEEIIDLIDRALAMTAAPVEERQLIEA